MRFHKIKSNRRNKSPALPAPKDLTNPALAPPAPLNPNKPRSIPTLVRGCEVDPRRTPNKTSRVNSRIRGHPLLAHPLDWLMAVLGARHNIRANHNYNNMDRKGPMRRCIRMDPRNETKLRPLYKAWVI
uniref:Uncharacterized protein n=1 Tax=Cacopsylla melanoneura TaxID=428564 RepID=A0A8D9A9T5_9HEMI